jgi:hypothetical protein
MKVTGKQARAERCPTCGAGPGEKCELKTGQPRTDPHRDRDLLALKTSSLCYPGSMSVNACLRQLSLFLRERRARLRGLPLEGVDFLGAGVAKQKCAVCRCRGSRHLSNDRTHRLLFHSSALTPVLAFAGSN